ncbi:MAG: translocation/assembly module TamB domain-containing protein [Deltaproteobacteria bacterium]|nr:translocation/assembly module TamB domain-containing protein [Deltaproteobacteria bacterium]
MAFFSFLVILSACAWWLTMTDSGARWLIQTVASTNKTKLTIQSVNGCLANQIHLSGVKLEWDHESLAIGSLKLHWRLWSLLQGRADIQELLIQDIHVALNNEEAPAGKISAGNQAPAMEPLGKYLPNWLVAELQRFSIKNFRVMKGENEVFSFKDLTLSLALANQNLTFQHFTCQTPYVKLDGKGNLQAKTMVLDMEAQVLLPNELVNHDLLTSMAISPSFPGKLKARGNIFAYEGDITLGDLKTQSFQLTSHISGNLDGLRLGKLYGHWLKGTLQGELLLDWERDFVLKGELFGRGLDPGIIDKSLPGEINLDIRGLLEAPAKKPLKADVAATLRPSTLLSHSISGAIEGIWDEKGLNIKHILVDGEGVRIKAEGFLAERLDFQGQIADLSKWLPQSRGRINAGGWLRWHDHYLALDAQGEAEGLKYKGISSPQATFLVRHTKPGAAMEARFSARRLTWEDVVFEEGEILAAGFPDKHGVDFNFVTAAGQTRLQGHLDASLRDGSWSASLTKLLGREPNLGLWTLSDAADLILSREGLAFSPMIFQGEHGGVLRFEGNYRFHTSKGYLQGAWNNLNLSPFSHWLPSGSGLWGQSTGTTTIRLERERLQLAEGHIQASGGIRVEDKKVPFEQIALNAVWQEKGLQGSLLVDLKENGRLSMTASSNQALSLSEFPDCFLSMDLQALDLGLLRTLYSESFPPLYGRLFARGEGRWLGNKQFNWQGRAHVENGSLGWRADEPAKGQILANIEKGELVWDWQKDVLNTDLVLIMGKGGRLKAQVAVPMAARWPIHLREQGKINGKISAGMHEWGLLTALLPDLVRETRGEIAADLDLAGTWQDPLLFGELTLKKMGGYLPSVGVQLEDISFAAVFQGQEAKIADFRARSGPGSLHGEGSLTFPTTGEFNYQLKLSGKDFQLANLPGIEMLSQPDLLVKGSTHHFSLTGQVLLYDLNISGTRKTPEVQASRDAVIISPQEPETQKPSDFDFNLQVTIKLGKNAIINLAGLNGRLEGEVMVLQNKSNEALATGQVRVVDGSYTAYGAKLNVKRGHINFKDGPADNPSLDILALREVGTVRAGVKVTGTAEFPEVNLYSQPAMPDKDILGYIFLGRPIRSEQQEADMLALGAGTLMPQGPGFFRRLGFTDVDLGGLFKKGGAVRLRYRLRDNLEIESTLGSSSGVDLFHVIEFE